MRRTDTYESLVAFKGVLPSELALINIKRFYFRKREPFGTTKGNVVYLMGRRVLLRKNENLTTDNLDCELVFLNYIRRLIERGIPMKVVNSSFIFVNSVNLESIFGALE